MEQRESVPEKFGLTNFSGMEAKAGTAERGFTVECGLPPVSKKYAPKNLKKPEKILKN